MTYFCANTVTLITGSEKCPTEVRPTLQTNLQKRTPPSEVCMGSTLSAKQIM